MPLIEGVGDEVLQFVVMTFLIAMTLVAWMSTNARPNRYRTLLVMRSHNPHPVTVSIRSRSHAEGNASRVTLTTSPTSENLLESGPIIPLQEMDSIVDADMALFENNRLHFYRRVEQSSSSQEPPEGPQTSEVPEVAGNDQIREMDSIVSAMEADITTSPRPIEAEQRILVGELGRRLREKTGDSRSGSYLVQRLAIAIQRGNARAASVMGTFAPESNPAPIIERVNQGKESTPAESTEDAPTVDDAEHRPDDGESKKILIRLKYLNDTLKEVEGSLDEPLKDFKWRHFSRELSGAWRVRLIHRGRVLADDGASLRALGLTHRAVVHALLHPPRTNQLPPSSPTTGPPTEGGTGVSGAAERGAANERGWDLENILMTLVSVALTVVWFFRCEYSNMFTASASVALFGLTVFYSVAIFGLYLSDTFQFDRRDRRDQPAATGATHAAPNATPNN